MKPGKLVANLLLLGVAVVLGYMLYQTITEPVKFTNEKDSRYADVRERLENIVEAQELHEKAHGSFAPTFDSLIYFMNNGQVADVKTIGQENDSVKVITKAQAIKLWNLDASSSEEELFDQMEAKIEKINEDVKYGRAGSSVVYMVKDSVFTKASKLASFKTPFDSLRYIPHSGKDTFQMTTDLRGEGAGKMIKVPYIMVAAYNKSILKGLDQSYFKLEEGMTMGDMSKRTMDILDLKIYDEE